MKQKLYVESTIISVLTSRPSRDILMAAMQEWTNQWWNQRRQDFDLFVSPFVLNEISLGDSSIAEQRLAIARALSVLRNTKTVRRFARKLYRALSLPQSARLDAFHLAIAIEGGMDGHGLSANVELRSYRQSASSTGHSIDGGAARVQNTGHLLAA
jgi:hypothetical protein